MKILITGGNIISSNRGINAITISTIYFLQKKYPQVEITLLITEPKNREVLYFEKKNKIKTISYSFLFLGLNYIFCIFSKFFPNVGGFLKKHIRIMNLYHSSDYIVSINEGDSFTDAYSGLMRFLSYYMLMDIAILLKKKIVLNPQTIGPFSSKFARYCAKRVIKHSFKIYTREKISEKLAKSFKIDAPIFNTHDMAFLLEKKEVSLKELTCCKN